MDRAAGTITAAGSTTAPLTTQRVCATIWRTSEFSWYTLNICPVSVTGRMPAGGAQRPMTKRSHSVPKIDDSSSHVVPRFVLYNTQENVAFYVKYTLKDTDLKYAHV